MLCISVFLVGLSLHYRLRGATPELVPVIMLLGSLTLTLGCVVALACNRPWHEVRVVMLDGSVVTLSRRKKSDALSLLHGLTQAMDWHRMGSIEIDAQRSSHLRQGVARGSRRSRRSMSLLQGFHERFRRHRASRQTNDQADERLQAGHEGHAGERSRTGRKRHNDDPTGGPFEQTQAVAAGSGKDSEPEALSRRHESAAGAMGRQPQFTGVGPVVAVHRGAVLSRLRVVVARISQRLRTRQTQR